MSPGRKHRLRLDFTPGACSAFLPRVDSQEDMFSASTRGARDGDRTHDLLLGKQPHCHCATLAYGGACPNRTAGSSVATSWEATSLISRLVLVSPTGFEPATLCAQGTRSSQAELRTDGSPLRVKPRARTVEDNRHTQSSQSAFTGTASNRAAYFLAAMGGEALWLAPQDSNLQPGSSKDPALPLRQVPVS